MSKDIKKLTITDLIKEKEKFQVKDDKTEELYIKRLDASITIQKPSRSLYLETMQIAYGSDQQENADIHMAYNIIVEPNLKDQQLQKEYGCVEPYDILEKIFEPGEINQIADTGLELAGYKTRLQKVNDIKN